MSEKSKIPGWARILLIILPYFFVVAFFQIMGALIAGLDIEAFETPKKTSIQDLLITLFSFLGTLLVTSSFVIKVDKEKFINIGLHLKNRLQDILIGLVVGAGIIIIGFGILIGLGEISFEAINWNFKEFLIAILLFTIVAIEEEVFCRGYIQKNLMTSFNKYFALVITALIFSLMHSFNPNLSLLGLINIFIAGIFLGLSYVYTKNLWFPIALHLSWNFFQSLLGFNVSGQNMYSLINISNNSTNFLNGGDFGLEGSILATILQVIAIFIIFFYYNKR
ncbi:CPBP family intramembrane glutamic endopeptidase [Zunongwangia endophytica]|uniref:CPBP family intramembrane glutamic endopeptidase n=1 Tax=Zunongwangia endophytica TaxID=1808945 RepID=A0ABV8H2Z8_9FLAO|nr:type II CAAX endopeptidase family protein [Zunongwangia endophytica]MDN3595991.1 type II CAAX endopeptidase family protein [Zunongwangia endophytica]